MVSSYLLETLGAYSKYAKSITGNLRISLSCCMAYHPTPPLNLISDNLFYYLLLLCPSEFGVEEEMMSRVIFKKKAQQTKFRT